MNTLRLSTDARGVATVELARESVLNAFDEAMIGEIAQAFRDLGADANARVIVLRAAGKAFCAGADLAWMQRQAKNSEADNRRDAQVFAEMMRVVHECPKPTVARVHGAAFGGGVGLMCACDIVIAAEGAKFAISEAKFGIIPAVIGPYVTNAIGPRHARRLALTAEVFGAAYARDIGLVHEVVPASSSEAVGQAKSPIDAKVDEIVSLILKNGPTALAEIKKLFGHLSVGPITAETRAMTAETIARLRMTGEAKEGFAAFFDKRPASWTK
jgi:methylglutaconyl-CoA hydratase